MKFKWNLQPEFQRYKENQHTYTTESGGQENTLVVSGLVIFALILLIGEIICGLIYTLAVLIQVMDMELINIHMTIAILQVSHEMMT